jgi:hypothetical protein
VPRRRCAGQRHHSRPLTPFRWSYGTSHIPTPENVPAGPIHEQVTNTGLNLIEVSGDHLPEPVGVPEDLRLAVVQASQEFSQMGRKPLEFRGKSLLGQFDG